jgi:hypothetical protein
MRRMALLAVGVGGLVVAVVVAGVLTVRRAPQLTRLTPLSGVAVAGPAIQVPARGTVDFGWCAAVARPVAAGQKLTAWTDVDRLGRTRVWRIEHDARPVCRFAESAAAAAASTRRLRVVALACASVGVLALAGLLLETWRVVRRG